MAVTGCLLDAHWMPILLDVIGHVDRTLPNNFLHGFQIIHDVPDSVVYRPTDHPLTLDEFCDLYDAIMLTNQQWHEEAKQRVWRAYTTSLRAAEKDDHSKLHLLKEVEHLTLAEVDAGLCSLGMTEAEFLQLHTDRDGVLNARSLP
jgi:hypothetical protein